MKKSINYLAYRKKISGSHMDLLHFCWIKGQPITAHGPNLVLDLGLVSINQDFDDKEHEC